MAGQAVVVPIPSNQVHQGTDRYEPIRFRRSCRRRATSHKDVVTWRYVALHGRPSSSFCQRRRSAAVTGSSETAYVGGWVVNFATYTRVYTVSLQTV